MHRLASLLLVTGCTIGAAARVAGTIDFHGHGHAAVDVEGNAGVTTIKLDDNIGVAHAPGLALLLFVGAGWGEDGARLTSGVDFLAFEPDGLGVAGGIHASFDHTCSRVDYGVGAVEVLATPFADEHPDQFGPNPRWTRLYHSAMATFGLSECSGLDVRSTGHVGLAYSAGVTKLEGSPGP